ncbi:MAG: hypothetical protein IJ867_03315 [Clostridia bacterium]|nr:hypothetical protein [Clostridia bacterium]
MIQAAQVASKFTLFTHHAKTFPDLVTALRNSMLRTGVFKNERTAEEQVVSVLNFDIHLVKDFRGRRYIERVTECIPVEEKNEYTYDHRKEKTLEGKFDKFFDNATVYFSKTTNRELYHHRNVLEFIDDKLVLSNPISEHNIREMRINMNDEDQLAFDAFLERNWGIKPPKQVMYDDDGNAIKTLPPKEKTQAEISKEYAQNFTKMMNEEAGKFVGGIGNRNLERAKAALEEERKAKQEIKEAERQAEKEAKLMEKELDRAIKEEERASAPKRRVIKSMFPGRSAMGSAPKKENNDAIDKSIRNELLNGIIDIDDEEDDEEE